MLFKYLLAKGLKIVFNPPAKKNCKIEKTSKICSGSELTNVEMGRYSYIGNKCFLCNVKIGSFCSIADGCAIGGAIHPINRVSTSPVFHQGKNIMKKNFAEHSALKTPITNIENDVWLGMGCYIKAGVTIHNGAVIGMGSIVTHDVPAYEIWAGNPAKKIKDRFDKTTAESLQNIMWWNWDDKTLYEKSNLFDDLSGFIDQEKKGQC